MSKSGVNYKDPPKGICRRGPGSLRRSDGDARADCHHLEERQRETIHRQEEMSLRGAAEQSPGPSQHQNLQAAFAHVPRTAEKKKSKKLF